MYIYTYMYIHTYIHTYIHSHTHTHIFTYIHTYIYKHIHRCTYIHNTGVVPLLARRVARHRRHDVVVEGDGAGHEHLVEALARRHHGQAYVGHALEVAEDWSGGVDEALDGGRQVRDVVAREGLEAVRLGEGKDT